MDNDSHNILEHDQFSRTVIENSPVGISVRSRTGKLLTCNQAWRHIWGIDDVRLENYMNRERSQLEFDDRDQYLGQWIPAVRKVYEEGGHLHIPDIRLPESRRRRARWVSQHFYAIKNARGDVEQVVILTEDITQRKQAELELVNSKSRYQILVENAPLSIVTINLAGQITSCNKACVKLSGYSKDEIIGKHFTRLGVLKVAEIPKFVKVFSDIFSGRVNEPYEVKCLRKDGSTIWVESNINLIREEGQITGIEVISRDVTHYRDAVEALRKSESKYRTLQANLPVGIFRSTPAGKIVSVNPALVRMYGYDDADEYLQTPAEDFYFYPEQRQKLLEKLTREKWISDYEGLMRRKDGTAFWILMSIRATFDNDGRMIYFDGIELDITERKEAEKRVADANREKYEQAKRVAGVFAHEIRNALFPAAAALNRLNTKYNEDPKNLAAVKKYLAIAEKAIASAADTTKLISAFSRLDSEIMPERVDLAGVVREIVKNQRLRIEELKAKVNINGDENVFVTSNRRQLSLAIGNLVLNSLQALKSSKKPKLEILWNQRNGRVNFSLKDNGCGIPSDILNNVFDLFFTTRQDTEGCGIGLAATKKIIEMYGGSIKASSKQGRWTRFDINLKPVVNTISPDFHS